MGFMRRATWPLRTELGSLCFSITFCMVINERVVFMLVCVRRWESSRR